MKTSHSIILIGIISGFFAIVMRLSIPGWLFILGALSALFFGVLHILFIYQIQKKFGRVSSHQQKAAWLAMLLFPLIFLFQPDFGDDPGVVYTYELITGITQHAYKKHAYIISILSSVLYVGIFIRWLMIKNDLAAENPKR